MQFVHEHLKPGYKARSITKEAVKWVASKTANKVRLLCNRDQHSGSSTRTLTLTQQQCPYPCAVIFVPPGVPQTAPDLCASSRLWPLDA